MIEKMDFDIGSLMYILITVIAVIAGVAGKKKKKQSQGTGDVAPEGKSSKGGFFGKLEEQFESFASEAKQSINNLQQDPVFQEDEPVFQEDEQIIEKDYFETLNEEYEGKQQGDFRNTIVANEGTFSPDDSENEELLTSEGISVTDTLDLIHLDEDHSRSLDDQEILENFDLRTAVIYSTIINRIEI